jgi:hypothetical protein
LHYPLTELRTAKRVRAATRLTVEMEKWSTCEQTDWGLVIIDGAHRVGAPYVRDDYRFSCGCWTTITLRTSTAKACTINTMDLVRRMNK